MPGPVLSAGWPLLHVILTTLTEVPISSPGKNERAGAPKGEVCQAESQSPRQEWGHQPGQSDSSSCALMPCFQNSLQMSSAKMEHFLCKRRGPRCGPRLRTQRGEEHNGSVFPEDTNQAPWKKPGAGRRQGRKVVGAPARGRSLCVAHLGWLKIRL